MLLGRPRTVDTTRARAAIRRRETDRDAVIASVVDSWYPLEARLPGGTDRPLALPIHDEVVHPEARRRPRLPTRNLARRSEQAHTIVTLTHHQQLRVQEAGVHEMGRGQEPLSFEILMDVGCHIAIGRRCRSGLDMRDQVRSLILARPGQMRLVPDPARTAFLGEVCRIIVRGTDELRGGRHPAHRAPGIGAPAHSVPSARIVLHPHPPQRLDRRDHAQPYRRIERMDRGEQGNAIGADRLGEGPACFPGTGESVIFVPARVALDPFQFAMGAQPIGGDRGENVEGMA